GMQLITIERECRHYFLVRAEIQEGKQGRERMLATVLDLTDLIREGDVAADLLRQIRHDLRGPLTSLRGAVDLLRSGRVGTMEARQAKLLDLMDRAARQMCDLLSAAGPEPEASKTRVP